MSGSKRKKATKDGAQKGGSREGIKGGKKVSTIAN